MCIWKIALQNTYYGSISFMRKSIEQEVCAKLYLANSQLIQQNMGKQIILKYNFKQHCLTHALI